MAQKLNSNRTLKNDYDWKVYCKMQIIDVKLVDIYSSDKIHLIIYTIFHYTRNFLTHCELTSKNALSRF